MKLEGAPGLAAVSTAVLGLGASTGHHLLLSLNDPPAFALAARGSLAGPTTVYPWKHPFPTVARREARELPSYRTRARRLGQRVLVARAPGVWYAHPSMCRIAGYLGAPLPLEALLTAPPRSLREQGHTPRELPPGMIGSDGHGVGWFVDHRQGPARYRSVMPIWVDVNLDTIAPFVRSSCIVASTRTAEKEMPVTITNTPPFEAGSAVLVHNGSIKGFHRKIAQPLRSRLKAETLASLCGNTDSEHLASLLADTEGPSLSSRLKKVLSQINAWVCEAGETAQLNLIVADGDELVAVRCALGEQAPTLYYSERAGQGVLVASEPLDEGSTWTRVAEGTMLIVKRGGSPSIERV